MRKLQLAAGLAATALMAGSGLAQTSPAPTQPVGSGQVITQMTPDLMRGSRLTVIDVYGADNQKIGDIDEVLLDRQGKIQGLVVGVGGFLGIGEKRVALAWDSVRLAERDGGRVFLVSATREQLEGMPAFRTLEEKQAEEAMRRQQQELQQQQQQGGAPGVGVAPPAPQPGNQ